MSVFEIAARKKFRFDTAKGKFSVEDLFDLPLLSTTAAPCLDDIARSLYKQLKESEEMSFVSEAAQVSTETQMKFDLVKRVIEIKKAEREASRLAAERRAQKQRIMEIMGHKQDEALQGKSLDELAKMLESL